MKKYPLNPFVYISLLILMVSCSPVIPRGFRKSINPEINVRPVFHENFNKALYRFEITLRKNNFTGLALIKKMNENQTHRMVFTSETGLKFFDFEFNHSGGIVVHYAMDALNRRGLIKMLTTDIGLLFTPNLENKSLLYYLPEDKKKGLILKERCDGVNYYYYEHDQKSPKSIYHKACFKPATKLEFEYDSGNVPYKISITNNMIHLKMNFQLINQ